MDQSISISWPRFLIGSGLFLIVTFTLLEPVISDPLLGWKLLLFWALHVTTALALLQFMQMLLSHVTFVAKQSAWIQVGLSGALGSVLFAPVAAGYDWILGVDEEDDPNEPFLDMLLGEFTGSVGIVLVVWVALNVSRLLHIQSAGPVYQLVEEHEPTFWDRVPKAIGRDLVALSAELHYMRVYTLEGEALILFPFGQAVSELEEVAAGLQIHRSHWVSLSQVEKVLRKGQGGLCITSTGAKFPVSRSRRKALEKALSLKVGAVTSMV